MITLSEKNFKKEVLNCNSGTYVLVDFYADWCEPCKQLLPTLKKLKDERGIKIGKVNVEENQTLVANYNVRNLPTLLLFQDGNIKDEFVGNVTYKKIERSLK